MICDAASCACSTIYRLPHRHLSRLSIFRASCTNQQKPASIIEPPHGGSPYLNSIPILVVPGQHHSWVFVSQACISCATWNVHRCKTASGHTSRTALMILAAPSQVTFSIAIPYILDCLQVLFLIAKSLSLGKAIKNRHLDIVVSI